MKNYKLWSALVVAMTAGAYAVYRKFQKNGRKEESEEGGSPEIVIPDATPSEG